MNGKYRYNLPQVHDGLFLTDGGIETTLLFHDKLELPYFSAFVLLQSNEGRAVLRRYFERYIELARRYEVGFVLESPTWRANADWARKLGYSRAGVANANFEAINLLSALRDSYETVATPIVISGCVGPRCESCESATMMTAREAGDYHGEQIGTFARSDADMVTAISMSNTPEAIGITEAAQLHGLPPVISFTVETNGHLPTGQPLAEAIAEVDAVTNQAPAYFMIDCAHPSHFEHVLNGTGAWLDRIRGLRSNASPLSHAELDEATDRDAGDPVDLGRRHAALRANLRKLAVLGGCCGADHRHVEQICVHFKKAA